MLDEYTNKKDGRLCKDKQGRVMGPLTLYDDSKLTSKETHSHHEVQ
jgi:hypothetical protein